MIEIARWEFVVWLLTVGFVCATIGWFGGSLARLASMLAEAERAEAEKQKEYMRRLSAGAPRPR